MHRYVALLRAVNVGGTGKLPMGELRAMGEACGFAHVRTFIASGNMLFASDEPEAAVKAALEERVAAHAGKHVPIFVRTSQELDQIIISNPFAQAHPSRHLVYFHDAPPRADLIEHCRDVAGERLALIGRELHVDYGDGIRFTKLKIPGKMGHTARSINSVTRIAALMRG